MDAPEGVQVAGLEGHVSRSAVYLIHKGSARRIADQWRMNPQASISKKRDAITAGV